MCRDVTAVVVSYINCFMHAQENHPTFALPWRATHVTSSPLEVAVTFLGSVLGSRAPGKVPLEDMVLEGHAQTMIAGGWLIRFSHIPLSPATISQD